MKTRVVFGEIYSFWGNLVFFWGNPSVFGEFGVFFGDLKLGNPQFFLGISAKIPKSGFLGILDLYGLNSVRAPEGPPGGPEECLKLCLNQWNINISGNRVPARARRETTNP